MIRTIRASKLFALVPEQSSADRISLMKIPIRRNPDQPDFSLILLELMVLTACIHITNAKRMFEFGTYLGNTTLHMALNSSPDARIWTLDADDETLKRTRDAYPRNSPLEFAGTLAEKKITALREDSHGFGIAPFRGFMDLILIDGDHSSKGVSCDTRNALGMLRENGCILWHDYRPDCDGCGENVTFLDNLSQGLPLVHIEDTALVLFLKMNGKSLF